MRKYETLAGGGEVLESHLTRALPEYLNAEVALKTVPDVSEAVRWLKSTFMYLRVRHALRPAIETRWFHTHVSPR